jgi:hypothetical protein
VALVYQSLRNVSSCIKCSIAPGQAIGNRMDRYHHVFCEKSHGFIPFKKTLRMCLWEGTLVVTLPLQLSMQESQYRSMSRRLSFCDRVSFLPDRNEGKSAASSLGLLALSSDGWSTKGKQAQKRPRPPVHQIQKTQPRNRCTHQQPTNYGFV